MIYLCMQGFVVYRGYMKWAIQYNIFIQIQHSSLRVPKSIWQVGVVYSFFVFLFLLYKAVFCKENVIDMFF